MNQKYFVFEFPNSKEWIHGFNCGLKENGKPLTIYYEDKKEQLIQNMIKKRIILDEYQALGCFYVFFDKFFIFCQKREYICFANFLNCDDIGKLYDILKPEKTPRQLTNEELILINRYTSHRLDYDTKCDKDLISSMIELAIEDAMLYKYPRSKKKARADYFEEAKTNLMLDPLNKQKDIRGLNEQYAYDARIFILNESELLDKYLNFLDIEPEVFLKLMRKKIEAFDLAPEPIKPKKKRSVAKPINIMINLCFSIKVCPLVLHYAIILLFSGIKVKK